MHPLVAVYVVSTLLFAVGVGLLLWALLTLRRPR